MLGFEPKSGYPLADVALIKGFPFHCHEQGILAIIGTHGTHAFNIRTHIGMSFCIHANSCWAVNGSLVFRTVHCVAAIITSFSLSKVGYCGSFHWSWPLGISSSSRTMRKSRTMINSRELTRCPVLLLLRIVIASLAGSVDIKSSIVDAGCSLLDTSKTLSHFLWLNFLEIAVIQSGRQFRTSMLGNSFVSSATF